MDNQTPIQNQDPVQGTLNTQPITPQPQPGGALEAGLVTLQKSWQIVMDHISVIAPLFGVVAILQIALTYFMPESESDEIRNASQALTIVFLTLLVIIVSYMAGIMITFLGLRRSEEWTIQGLFNLSVPKIFGLFWVSLLTGIAVVLGFIVLVVPGIYLSIALSFATYIYLDQNIGGVQSLTLSREYVKGYWWSILWRFILLGVIILVPLMIVSGLLHAQPLMSGIFSAVWMAITTPLATIYGVLIYEQLKKIKQPGV